MPKDLLYQIALTLIPNVGCVQAKILVEKYETAENIFRAKKKELGLIENIGVVRASAIKAFDDFSKAEDEIRFIEKRCKASHIPVHTEIMYSPGIQKVVSRVNDSELRGWNSSYTDLYNIHATPTYFILDANNKIISKPDHVGDVLEYFKVK